MLLLIGAALVATNPLPELVKAFVQAPVLKAQEKWQDEFAALDDVLKSYYEPMIREMLNREILYFNGKAIEWDSKDGNGIRWERSRKS